MYLVAAGGGEGERILDSTPDERGDNAPRITQRPCIGALSRRESFRLNRPRYFPPASFLDAVGGEREALVRVYTRKCPLPCARARQRASERARVTASFHAAHHKAVDSSHSSRSRLSRFSSLSLLPSLLVSFAGRRYARSRNRVTLPSPTYRRARIYSHI